MRSADKGIVYPRNAHNAGNNWLWREIVFASDRLTRDDGGRRLGGVAVAEVTDSETSYRHREGAKRRSDPDWALSRPYGLRSRIRGVSRL